MLLDIQLGFNRIFYFRLLTILSFITENKHYIWNEHE